MEGFYTDLSHVFVLEDIGKNEVGDVINERRNGNGARVYLSLIHILDVYKRQIFVKAMEQLNESIN